MLREASAAGADSPIQLGRDHRGLQGLHKSDRGLLGMLKREGMAPELPTLHAWPKPASDAAITLQSSLASGAMAEKPAKKRRMEAPPPTAHCSVLRLARHAVTLPEGALLSPGAAHGTRVAVAVSGGGLAAAAAAAALPSWGQSCPALTPLPSPTRRRCPPPTPPSTRPSWPRGGVCTAWRCRGRARLWASAARKACSLRSRERQPQLPSCRPCSTAPRCSTWRWQTAGTAPRCWRRSTATGGRW